MMTVEQIPSPVSTSESNFKNDNDKMTCQDVGLIFAREYYTFLNKKPSRLHGFYGADSLFTRGDEAELVPIIQGQEEIRKKIQELDFDNCKVLVTQVDSQISSNDGIIISVLGEISNKEMPSQKFAETFFLAPQPNGYYILNNIFRFLKDKVDIDYYKCEDEEEEVEKVDNTPIIEEEKKGEKNGVLEDVVPPVANIKEVPKIEEEKPEVKKSDQVKPLDTKVVETKPELLSKEPEVLSKETEAQPKEPEVIKKEKSTKKTSNKKTEEQLANVNNNIPLIKNKEHTNNKNEGNNKSEVNTTKDQSKPNQRGINKPNNNVAKTWADLAAPAASSIESTEAAKPLQQNQYQNQQQQLQYRAQSSQQPAYSPNMHLQNSTPHHQHQQQHNNTSYNYQHHQQHNTHNYNQHQMQQQPQQPQQQQHYQHHNKDGQQQLHHHHRKDNQIFVKNVNSSMTEAILEEEFSKFGPIKNINIGHAKNCAFIDFGSIESTQKALEQHKVMVSGVQVLAEERRPPRYNNHRQQYDNNNNNRRFQQNKRGGGTSGANIRGGSGGNPLDKRGGGTGGGQK